MNNVLIRLFIVKNGKEYNVLFDNHISIDDNLKLLSSLIDESFENYFVYDKKLNIFLNKNTKLENFNVTLSRTFYIY